MLLTNGYLIKIKYFIILIKDNTFPHFVDTTLVAIDQVLVLVLLNVVDYSPFESQHLTSRYQDLTKVAQPKPK